MNPKSIREKMLARQRQMVVSDPEPRIEEPVPTPPKEKKAKIIPPKGGSGTAPPKPCDHEWGIDGQHSNEYCKKCFTDKPKAEPVLLGNFVDGTKPPKPPRVPKQLRYDQMRKGRRRLPDGAVFTIGPYDAAREMWTGELTVEGKKFTAESAGVGQLTMDLDDLYEKSLGEEAK